MKFYFERFINMNFRQMFKTIKKVHNRSGKSNISIFFDMVFCSIKYKAGYTDYFLFNFEELNDKERSTYITRGVNDLYIKKFNDRKYYDRLDDKILFNRIFKKYIKRNFISLKEVNEKEFASFFKKNKTIIAKPIDSHCGNKVEKYSYSKNTNIKKLYNELINNEQYLIEEVVKQSDELNKLYPNSVNTIRVVTITKNNNTNIVFSSIRIGTGNNVVDNFNHGGIYTVINSKGIITKLAINREGEVFENHPNTNTRILGFKIPYYNEIIKMAKEVSKIVPEIGYVGWDFAITNDGPVIIEGNQLPGYDLYQSKYHLDTKEGLKPVFDKSIDNFE